MQITSRFVSSLVACALFGGCAGVSSTRIVGDTVGAAGGALLGKTLGKGSSLGTALGAGGGLLLSETLQAGSTSHAKKSYAEGYEKGRSDSIKRQYQALNERQRFAPQSDDAAHLRLFDVPLPEREQNGVILAPGTATLRIGINDFNTLFPNFLLNNRMRKPFKINASAPFLLLPSRQRFFAFSGAHQAPGNESRAHAGRLRNLCHRHHFLDRAKHSLGLCPQNFKESWGVRVIRW